MNEASLPFPPFPATPGTPPPGPVVPMTFGQMLDRIFRILRGHVWLFTGIGAIPFGIVFGLYAVIGAVLFLTGAFPHPPAQPDTATILWIVLPVFLIIVPVSILLYGLYYGASAYAALRADQGFKVTVSESFSHAWSKAGRYVWLMFLRGLIVGIPIFVCAFAVFGGVAWLGLLRGEPPNPAALFLLIPLVVLFYIGAFVYAILVSLRLSLAFPVCVQEGLTASQSLKRSGVLTTGAKGRIFLMLVVIYAIGYACAMVFYAVGLFIFAIGALANGGHLSTPSPWIIGLAVALGRVVFTVALLWSVLLMAAYSIAFVVFYRDQRLRQEGMPPAPAGPGLAV